MHKTKDMKYKIRNMIIDDYISARKLWEKTPGMKLEAADSEESISIYLNRNPELSFVAEANNKIVGTIICGEDGRRGYLQHLCVDSNYQNIGIGTSLLDSAINRFSNLNLHEIRIFILKNNSSGNKFSFSVKKDRLFKNLTVDKR